MSNSSVNCQLFWKRHGSPHIFAFSIFEKWSGNLENLPRIFVVSKKKCIFVPSSRRKRLKTAGKDHRKAFLWRCGTPYMEKAYITRFVLDDQKPEKFHIHQRTSATIDAHGYVISDIVAYMHIGVGFGVARSTDRAMPEPRCVGRVTGRFPRFFI